MTENKPKYKVGDLLLLVREDKSKFMMPVDSISTDDDGRFIYRHKVTDNCGLTLYEDDVKCCIKPGTKVYEEYQLYLKLKKKYG